MSHSLLIAFVLFATVMFFTPGPNNIMLLSSGLTYGFRRPSRMSRASRSALPSWSARSGLGLAPSSSPIRCCRRS